MTVFDVFDDDDIQFGFHVVSDRNDGGLNGPFDDAEVWLAAQDTPDPYSWDDPQ